MTNETSRIDENVEKFSNICRHTDKWDVTYKLMYNNFDQAVLRETLSYGRHRSPNATNEIM